MASLYSEADKNVRNTWLLMLTFLLVVIGLGWAFSFALSNPTILYAAVAFALVMNVGSFWYSDKLALATSGATPAEGTDFLELNRIVENIAITAGVPKPRVFVIHDPAPNAFATGRDPAHAAVAVTTGLLHSLERSELEGVIAHEISHIKNRDTLVMMVVIVLLGFVTLISDLFIRSTIYGTNGNREGDNRVRAVMVIVGFLLAILSPVIAQLIQFAISRKREFLADASGALLTRYPEGLASALQKIGSYPAPLRRANHATAHLFIANPFGANAFQGFNKLFSTHPPVSERVRALIGR